jgi:hypothetical protein
MSADLSPTGWPVSPTNAVLLSVAFELPILTAWVAACYICLRVRKFRLFLWPLIIGSAVTCCLEVANEYHGNLTTYDAPYALRCLPFHFPAAIVCGGGLYSAALCAVAHRVERSLRLHGIRLFWPLWLALTTSAVPIEMLGIRLGLWKWVQPRPWSLDFTLGVWKYYLFCLAPGAIAFKLATPTEVLRSDSAQPG